MYDQYDQYGNPITDFFNWMTGSGDEEGASAASASGPTSVSVEDAQGNLWLADFASGKLSLQKTYKGESSNLSASMSSSTGKNYLRNLLDVSGNEEKLLGAAKAAADDPGTNTAVAAKRALTDAMDMKAAGVSGSTGLARPADPAKPKKITEQEWFVPALAVGGVAAVVVIVAIAAKKARS